MIYHLFKHKTDTENLWERYDQFGLYMGWSDTLHIHRELATNGKLHKGLHPDPSNRKKLPDIQLSESRIYWYEIKRADQLAGKPSLQELRQRMYEVQADYYKYCSELIRKELGWVVKGE